VLGFDYYGAERRSVWIVNSLVIHGHAEVAGCAVSLNPWVGFFESAPHGFLPLVEAEEDLCRGSPLLIE
jgi:hypothetical protein